MGDSGRREKRKPDPSRPRPPPHLKGKEIGLWYAKNSRGGRKKREMRDIQHRAVVSIEQPDESYLNTLLNDVKENKLLNNESDVGCFSTDYEESYHSMNAVSEKLISSPEVESLSLDVNPLLDDELYQKWKSNNIKSENIEPITAYQKMLEFRRQLPSFKMQKEILEMVKCNQVSLISGETGCGKTTQVAQFILDDYIQRRCGSACHIICTQPRRISAISVAERVAAERNERVGVSCGYQIRLESKLPRKQGSILYVTLGILLRFMIDDPNIVKASHIIIDEIHERDTLSDFLLVIIKDLLSFRPNLKIILMSATLNARIFSNYFVDCPIIEIPGSAYFVQEYCLEDMLRMINYRPCPVDLKKHGHWNGRGRNNNKNREYLCYLDSIERQYSPNVVNALRNMDFEKIDIDLIVAVITYVCQLRHEGAILIFLPGWQDINKLNQELMKNPVFSNTQRFLIIPLHSRLPTVSQREVFDRPPPGCRKIIIATNIAETSITIDDVVYVINCGKAREKNFNGELGISSLDSGWISKASEKQRRGRAGRVQDGYCFHLYTRYHQSLFREYQLPEMLRTPLESLCLQIKILKLGKMWDFLSKAIEPPSMESCELAIKELTQMRALNENENLTSLGYHLALIPVAPKIGRMILFGAIFSCLDPILTVAGSVDSKDPFFTPLGKEKEADIQKKILSKGSKSDHIALINAFNGWEKARRGGFESSYCYKHFLSMNNLKFIAGIKSQLAQLLNEIGFVNSSSPKSPDNNLNSDNVNLIKSVICAGLYPNVAKVEYNLRGTRMKIYTVGNTESSLRVELHPKSINSSEKHFESQWLIYHQKMKTTKIFLFDSTMISPYPLLFFGGLIKYHQQDGLDTIEVDNGIKFHSSIQTAKVVMDLRVELDLLLGKKIKNPSMQLVVGRMSKSCDEKILKAIIDLITAEKVNVKSSTNFPFNPEEFLNNHQGLKDEII